MRLFEYFGLRLVKVKAWKKLRHSTLTLLTRQRFYLWHDVPVLELDSRSLLDVGERRRGWSEGSRSLNVLLLLLSPLIHKHAGFFCFFLKLHCLSILRAGLSSPSHHVTLSAGAVLCRVCLCVFCNLSISAAERVCFAEA